MHLVYIIVGFVYTSIPTVGEGSTSSAYANLPGEEAHFIVYRVLLRQHCIHRWCCEDQCSLYIQLVAGGAHMVRLCMYSS